MGKNDPKKKKKKWINHLKKYGLLIALFCLFIVILILYTIPAWFKANTTGEEIGRMHGNLVGTAVGSFIGWTEKNPEGWKKGKEEGLSAADTIVEVKNSLNEVANLEVLVASVKLNNGHEIGKKYAAFYLLKADAVFSIDLSRVSVETNEDGSILYIRVTQPEVKVYIDDREIEKVIEYQRKFFNGSAEEGFDAYINSMSNLGANAENEIVRDKNLMESARNSAEKQIRQLTRNILFNGEELLVVWE